MIFGKNSDRPADECQPLVLTPAATHQPIQDAGCQYVDVPQAAETCRVVGSKPWWCAGYEHGFNEHMVVIGNEGLPTKLQAAASSDTRLVGMEIVRIALERSRSAAEAVDVITSLVETHGQGKFGRPDPSAQRGALGNSYDNSFLVADPREAYVVECAGFDWAVRKVKSADRCWSISNVSNLSEQDLKVSATAQASAVTLAATVTAEPVAGGTVAGPGLQWTASFGDLKAARNGATRQARSAALLNALAPPSGPGVDALSMMLTLSDHGDSTTDTGFVVNIRPPGAVSLCVHNRHDLSNRGTTAASLVADFPKLGDDGSMERLPVYWCAMYSPCLSIYLPVFIEADLPPQLSIGEQHPSADSPWWLFHAIGQDALRQGASREAKVRAAFAPLQQRFLQEAYTKATEGHKLIASGEVAVAARMLSKYIRACVEEALEVARKLRPEGSAAAAI